MGVLERRLKAQPVKILKETRNDSERASYMAEGPHRHVFFCVWLVIRIKKVFKSTSRMATYFHDILSFASMIV